MIMIDHSEVNGMRYDDDKVDKSAIVVLRLSCSGIHRKTSGFFRIDTRRVVKLSFLMKNATA